MNRKTDGQKEHRPRKVAGAMLVMVIVVATLLLGNHDRGQASAAANGKLFVPLVATSSRSGPPPAYLAGVPLTDALCPNDIAINQNTGLVYVPNEYSDNVSLLNGAYHLGNIPSGGWPNRVESDPLSSLVYVTHIRSGVSVFEGDKITAQIEAFHETFGVTVNTVNGYTYVTDLGNPITILQGSQKIKDLFVPDYKGKKIEWQLASTFDEKTGLTYFANWENDAITVVDGLEVVDQFPYYGQGANDIVVDSQRQLLYVANLRAQESGDYHNNISIVDLKTHEVTPISTARHSRNVALDAATGIVYVTNTSSNSVTVLRGKGEVGTYYLGKEPRAVTVDPYTGFAYVVNSGELSVSVLRDGQPVTTLELPPEQGFRPYALAVDPNTQRLYVANRSSVTKHSDEMTRNVTECKAAWVHIFQ